MNKLLVFVLLLQVLAVSAQTNSVQPDSSAGCGPRDADYKVSTTDDAAIPEPASGMATVVFIEDQVRLRPGHPTCLRCANKMKLGMDGQWIAAGSGISHVAVSVAPGDHHFCALASPSLTGKAEPSMYGLNVEAGKTYFLRGRLMFTDGGYIPVVDLSLINEDEGRFMVSTSRKSALVK